MAADQAIERVHTDAVLVSVATHAILLDPPGIQVFLPESVGVVLPGLGYLALLDVFVLPSALQFRCLGGCVSKVVDIEGGVISGYTKPPNWRLEPPSGSRHDRCYRSRQAGAPCL